MIQTRNQTWTRPPRPRGWALAFATAAIAALVLMLYLGHRLTFFNDEWLFIDTRLDWNLAAFMAPHDGHWILGEALLWKPLLAAVGLRSYLPYLLVELAAHLITAAAIFWWLRREAGGFLAFMAGLVFLFLGTGGEVFFQGLPLNLVGATAAGSWALVLFLANPQPRRRWPVPLLLLISMTFGGDGLFFLAAVGAVACVTPGRLRQFWVVLPAAGAYGLWLLTFGQGALHGVGVNVSSDPHALLQFIQVGLGNGVGSLSGLGEDIGLILGVILVGATVAHLFGDGRIREAAVAGAAGLSAQLVITAVARGGLGPDQATAPRYVYISAVFLLFLLAGWLRDLPRRAPERRAVFPALLLVGVSLAANLHALSGEAAIFVASADETRAAITVLTRFGGTPAIPSDRPATDPKTYLGYLPSPARLKAILATAGSPLHDALLPDTPVPPAVLDRVLLQIVAGSLTITAPATPPANAVPRDLVASGDLSVEAAGNCATLRANGPAPHATLAMTSGWLISLTADSAATAGLSLSVTGAFQAAPTRTLTLVAGTVTQVTLPDLGSDVSWQVRLDPPVSGATLVCFAPPPA